MIQKMKYGAIGIVLPLMLLVLPFVTFAQGTTTNGLQRLVAQIGALIQAAVPLVIGLAILLFLWGIFKLYFLDPSEENRKEGRKLIVWGLIAIVVMVSVWGLVKILQSAIIANESENAPLRAPIAIPTSPTSRSGN